VSRAPAENVTGEATVAPLPGAQILTVLSVVAVQVCAEAPFAKRNSKKKAVAVDKNERSDITTKPQSNEGCQESTPLPAKSGITDLRSRSRHCPLRLLENRKAQQRLGLSSSSV
jgi:hypothetical protein